MRCVLTGPLGVGKSTIVRRVMAELGWVCPAGFFTQRVDGQAGDPSLIISTWDGVGLAIARWGDEGMGLGAHRVDTAALERFAQETLSGISEVAPVVLDELGVLELGVEAFVSGVAALFSRNRTLLAVVQERALDAWLRRIGRELVDRLEIATEARRDELPRILAAAFKAR